MQKPTACAVNPLQLEWLLLIAGDDLAAALAVLNVAGHTGVQAQELARTLVEPDLPSATSTEPLIPACMHMHRMQHAHDDQHPGKCGRGCALPGDSPNFLFRSAAEAAKTCTLLRWAAALMLGLRTVGVRGAHIG